MWPLVSTDDSRIPEPEGLTLRPFRGVRFALPNLAEVTSPPYDLIDDDTVRALRDTHPNNVVRLILPGRSEERYRSAADTLRRWLGSRVLTVDDQRALYVYEQVHDGVTQRGLIGNVGLSSPARRIVMPHEHVLPGPVADRLALMRVTEANLEPIFLLYDGGGAASTIVDNTAIGSPPLVEAGTEDGVRHRLWAITSTAQLEAVADDLRDRQALIADGHHRYATYRALQQEQHQAGRGQGPWDSGLALLVDSSRYQPELAAIHRVIPGLPIDEAAERAKPAFHVRQIDGLDAGLAALKDAGRGSTAFLLAATDRQYLLSDPDPVQAGAAMPPEASPNWRALSTSVLAQLVIPRLWNITEDDESVQVVHHDPAAAVRLARRTVGTAVILNPLVVDNVLAVAAHGERVPRKSTSFGPKPRTGLVMRTFAAG